jgi:hypothetical protein
MNRITFAHSRMLITYADGSSNGTCSIYCGATALQIKGKKVKSLQVADYDSKKLIDAKNASWVIGGKKQGVMTAVAKWAFADKKGAETFIKQQGGKLTSFEVALKESDKEVTASIQESKEIMHKGH